MKKISLVVFVVAISMLGGCLSYTDSKVKNLDQSEYATIFVDISLDVKEINGKRVPLGWLTAIDELNLPPGKHTFKIIWDNIHIQTEPITADLELEAGARYNLLRVADLKNSTWNFKLEKQ